MPFALVDVAAGAADELEDFDDDEPPPQPATAIAAAAISRAIHRRAVFGFLIVMFSLRPQGRRELGFPSLGREARSVRDPESPPTVDHDLLAGDVLGGG